MALIEQDAMSEAEKTARDEAAADAKAYLDSAVSTLTLPVPLLMGIGFAAYSLATKPTPSEEAKVSLAGVDVPLTIAVVLVMSLNSLLLLHIARMVSLLNTALLRKSTRQAVADVLLYHPDMLNPFAGTASFRGETPGCIAYLLSLLPKLLSGGLLGFYFVFLVSLKDMGPVDWPIWFAIAVAFLALLHTLGVGSVILTIPWLIFDLTGRRSALPFYLGLAVGLVIGSAVDWAIGTPI